LYCPARSDVFRLIVRTSIALINMHSIMEDTYVYVHREILSCMRASVEGPAFFLPHFAFVPNWMIKLYAHG
jgi:hypothetical protein